MNKEKISFVIPCYGSENTIVSVVNDIKKTMKQDLKSFNYEIILVNDSSYDQLGKVIETQLKNDVLYIELAKNFGQHSAIMAGLNHTTGDIIVCLDDDGQTPPKETKKLITALDEDTDVVYAKYAVKKHSKFRNFGSIINDKMLEYLLGKPKDLYISSFFAMKKYVKEEILKYQNPYPYLGGLVLRITNKIKNVEVEHKMRENGHSTYTLHKLIRLWVNGLTNFSIKPLRLSICFSLLFVLFAIIMSIILVIRKLMNPLIPIGWTSLIIALLFIGSAICLLLGIIGEYIGRIYISINHIPQYVERKK